MTMNSKEKKYTCAVSVFLSDGERKEWQELWNASELRHIFNAPVFFEACLEVLEYKKYAVIFCYRNGALCGVLPLVQDRIFGIKVFACPGRKSNYADKNAILVDEYDQDIFNALSVKASELGNIYLVELNENEKRMFSFSRLSGISEQASRSRWMILNREQNSLGVMSSNQKKTLFKRISEKKKDLKFIFFESNLMEAFDTVIEVEKKSYKPDRLMAFFAKKKGKLLIEAIIKRSPKNVRIGLLYFQDKPVATVLGFVYGKTFAKYHSSFLKEHVSWGAGKMVAYFTQENLKNSGFEKNDFLRGDTSLKKQMTNNISDQYNYYFSKSPMVILWWKICLPANNMINKIKIFLLSILSKIDFLSDKIYTVFRRKTTTGYDKAADYPVKNQNISGNKSPDCGMGGGMIIKKNKKPVVFFSTYDSLKNPYYGGGGAISVHEAAKRLSAKYKICVLAGKYSNCPKKEFLDGVFYEYIGSDLFGPKLGQIAYHMALPYYVASRKFDLWVESFTPPFSTSFLPLFTKKPVVGLVHMLSSEDMRRKYKISFSRIENFGIKMYDNFIVLTEQTSDKIKKINPKARVEIIPNGINLAVAPSSVKSAKKHLLFIGRIEIDQKGLDLLLESYKLIMEKIDYPLIIAGQGTREEEKKLIKMIEGYNFSGRVKFIGRADGQKKSEIFQTAAGVVIPSRFETFSLVALESLSYGVPIISFDIEGLKWLPEKFAFKAKSFDAPAMAGKMEKLLEKNSNLSIDPNDAKFFLKDYSWEKIAGKFESCLDSIIKLNI